MLKYLGTVVVLGVEHTHEAEPRGPVQVTGIEQHSGHLNLALKLLQERGGAVHGKQHSRSGNEYDITGRCGLAGDLASHQLIEWLAPTQHGMNRLRDLTNTRLTLGLGNPLDCKAGCL